MSIDPYRVLGFAFASADLLFEVEGGETVTFAVGAAQGACERSESELVGQSWRTIVAFADHAMVEALLSGLENGRRGPITVETAPGPKGERRFAALSACRLPPNANISCAMSLGAPAPIASRTIVDDDGYQDRDSFESVAKAMLTAACTIGHELDLALVELPGLGETLKTLGPQKASSLLKRFSDALRTESYGGAPAARLDGQRFAVIRQKGAGSDRMNHRLEAALALAEGGAALEPRAQVLAIEGEAGSLDRSMRALRYAIGSFVDQGAKGLAGASLNDAFNRSVQRTLAEAGEFGRAVKDRQFSLVFQPVVSLATGKAVHFETLVRFQEDVSPYKLIRMAEELDLIEELDLAIAGQVVDRIATARDKDLKLAINVSGHSIIDPWFIAEVRRLFDGRRKSAPRLILEITESVAIENLALADRHIQELRRDGHVVCLDDFGAGASSYAYLQKLHVDVIKIDGRYVRELAEDSRDSTLVRHLVNLCRELGVSTIAEMISSQAIEDAARLAGVDYGQGFFYGQPSSEPVWPFKAALTAPPLTPTRRKGAMEQWG